MPKKEAAPLEPVSVSAEQQEIARLRRERDTLKDQLHSTATREVLPVLYETTNPAESARYGEAGGVLVSITKLYPGSIKSGKRYGFAQTKDELEALVKKMTEEAIV